MSAFAVPIAASSIQLHNSPVLPAAEVRARGAIRSASAAPRRSFQIGGASCNSCSGSAFAENRRAFFAGQTGLASLAAPVAAPFLAGRAARTAAMASADADTKMIDGGVTAPKGFRAAGIIAGLKASGKEDMALIVSDVDAVAGGVFTTCRVCAAPVTYDRETIKKNPSKIRAVLVNSGQANAATGDQGWADAVRTAELLGKAMGVPSDACLVASTGVIGQRIKMDKLEEGIPKIVAALGSSAESAMNAAKAICTTDLVTKTIAFETVLSTGKTVRVGGMCKGSGMIHPNMATMLAFITCDAKVDPGLWQAIVSRAADKSFNQVTVDGDTSTNDTLLGFANGQADPSGPAISDPASADAVKLEGIVTTICQYLARCIARDGEGATVLFEVTVSGAPSDADARAIARTIVRPELGPHRGGGGRAGVEFDPAALRIELGEFVMMDKGQPLPYDRAAASAYMKAAKAGAYLKEDTVAVKVSVGSGPGYGQAFGCDLSYDYVKINAEYTT
eukprot:tig00021435_g21381.t1